MPTPSNNVYLTIGPDWIHRPDPGAGYSPALRVQAGGFILHDDDGTDWLRMVEYCNLMFPDNYTVVDLVNSRC